MAEGRQLFSYKGVEYDLPASYTRQQALARIKSHLGETGATPTQQQQKKTSVGILEGLRRGVMEDVPYGLGTATDFLAGGLASTFGATKDADEIFATMEARSKQRKALQQQRSQTEEQGTGSKIAQAITGAVPQMLTSHATQAAEDVMAGGGNKSLSTLGVNTAAQLGSLLLPAGRGVLKGAGIGAVTSAPISMATDAVNRKILQGTAAEENYKKTAEDYLIEAAAGGVTGGVLGALPSKKPPKPGQQPKPNVKPDVDSRLDARMSKQNADAIVKAKTAADLIPADIETPAPAGTNFEMQLPDAAGTKKGKKEYIARQKAKGTPVEEQPIEGLTPEEQAAQLDMFVEDNRKVVEDNMFRSALEQSQAAAAAESRKLIEHARALEEQAQTDAALSAQQRRDYTRRAQELFDEAAAREAHAQRVFDSNLRASADAEAQRSQGMVEDAALQEQGILDREAAERRVFQRNLEQGQLDAQRQSATMMADRRAQELARQQIEHAREMDRQRELWAPRKKTPEITEPTGIRVGDSYTPDTQLPLIGESPYGKPVQSLATRDAELKISGEAAARNMVDQYGNPLRDSLPIETSPAIVPETAPFWKNVETEKAWAQYNTEQEMASIARRMKEIREQARARGLEEEWEALEAKLLREPSPNYGMGAKTRNFIQEQALQQLRKRQGGYFDPKVFVDGFKAAFDLVASGVKSFGRFAKEMTGRFGDAVKPYLQRMWKGSNEHINATRKDTMGFIQKHGIPLREALNGMKDATSLEFLNRAVREMATVKDIFKSKVFDQKYGGNIFTSGVKYGEDAPLVRLFKNKEKDSMLKKYAPYMNTDTAIDPRALGWSKGEIEAYLDLRDSLDMIGEMEGINIGANPNYFPRMRIGKNVVVARDAEGNLHVESSDIPSSALARQLEAEGYTIQAHGTKRDIYNYPEYKSLLADDFLAEGYVPDPFAAHKKSAGNIPGWTGQRGDPKDLVRALEIYLQRAENGLKRDAVAPILREAKDLLDEVKTNPETAAKYPTWSEDKYEALAKYLEKAVGLEFLHTPKFISDIENTLNKTAGFRHYDTVTQTAAKVFYWSKVITGVQNGIQAVMSPLFAAAQINKLSDNGVSVPKAIKYLSKATVSSMFNLDGVRDKQIASRAERAGYIQNPTDMVGIGRKLGRSIAESNVRDVLYDPFRASRIEMKARKDFMVGMYNYYVHEMKLDSESAFHKAGQDTLDAFVNLHPEDRANWQGSLGKLGSPFGALSTYPVGMASKLYQNLGRSITPGQKKALVTMGIGAFIMGGARGLPVTEVMNIGTFLYNLIADDDELLSSADDALIQLAEKNPDIAWAIHGIPSKAFGVDMSRSLGWPGLSNLIPAWMHLQDLALSTSNAAFGTDFRTDGMIPPAFSSIAKMGKGAYDLYQNSQTGGMNPGEIEAANQAAYPRFAQKMFDTPQVYTKKGDLIGEVSEDANLRAQLTGTRSLEEAEIRANEAQIVKQKKAVQETKKSVLDDITRTALYSKKLDKEQFAQKINGVVKKGVSLTGDEIVESIIQEALSTKLDPNKRAAINKDVLRLVLEYKQKKLIEEGQQ